MQKGTDKAPPLMCGRQIVYFVSTAQIILAPFHAEFVWQFRQQDQSEACDTVDKLGPPVLDARLKQLEAIAG